MNAVVDLGGSEATAPRSNFANMQRASAPHNMAMHMPAMQYVIARSEMCRRVRAAAAEL